MTSELFRLVVISLSDNRMSGTTQGAQKRNDFCAHQLKSKESYQMLICDLWFYFALNMLPVVLGNCKHHHRLPNCSYRLTQHINVFSYVKVCIYRWIILLNFYVRCKLGSFIIHWFGTCAEILLLRIYGQIRGFLYQVFYGLLYWKFEISLMDRFTGKFITQKCDT